MSKRILLITETLGSGGAERQICGLAVMLTKAGYPCRLITYVNNQFYEPYLRDNGVEYELVSELCDKKSRVWRTARYIQKYNPGIIISYLQSVNMTLCLANCLNKARLIVSERNNNTSVTFKDKLLFNLYRLADVVVPNSHSQGRFICNNFPFLSKKVYPIINFVDVNRFKPATICPSNDTLRVIIVARYTHQKNVLTFLDVVRKAKDRKLNVHFDWYGSKEYDITYFEKVLRKYESLEIQEYLSLNAPSDKIEEEYQKSDIMCLPSLYEGYPNVIVEAMSCGLPILCANRFENPYIVEEKVNGFLFDPENIDDILAALEKMLALTSAERRIMGQINRKLCLQRNTEDAFLQSYVKLIEEL